MPEDKVRSRWTRAHDNLIMLLDLVDDVLVFSNDAEEPVLVAERIGRRAALLIRDSQALPEISRRLLAAI